MDLNGIVLSEKKSVRQRQIPYDFTYMWNPQNNINDQIKQKQNHRYRKQTDGCQMGGVLEG